MSAVGMPRDVRSTEVKTISAMASIVQYRDFWDVPRIFVARYQDELFLFDCPFDEDVEDFPDSYKVYRMPALTHEDLAGSWYGLEAKAIGFLGEVPISKVQFDGTRRKEIDAGVLEHLTARAKAG